MLFEALFDVIGTPVLKEANKPVMKSNVIRHIIPTVEYQIGVKNANIAINILYQPK